MEYYSNILENKENTGQPSDAVLNNWILCDEWARLLAEERKREKKEGVKQANIGTGGRHERTSVTF